MGTGLISVSQHPCFSEGRGEGQEGVDEGTLGDCSHPGGDDGGWGHQQGHQVLVGKTEQCEQRLTVLCIESLDEGSEGMEGITDPQVPRLSTGR